MQVGQVDHIQIQPDFNLTHTWNLYFCIEHECHTNTPKLTEARFNFNVIGLNLVKTSYLWLKIYCSARFMIIKLALIQLVLDLTLELVM